MTTAEGLLIVIALSLNTFQIAENEGSNMHKLNAFRLMTVCLIFLLIQMAAMGVGYGLTQIPFFRRDISPDVRSMCYVIAAVIFFLLGGYLLYKALKKEELVERLCELKYRRIALEAIAVAVLTLAAGFGCGLLKLNPVQAFVLIMVVTVAAVIVGLYTGYYQGSRFRRFGTGIGAAVFFLTGAEILIRYF